MIEQAKMKRQKCIDDSSSSSDMNGSVNYNEPIHIEENNDDEKSEDQEYIDF